MYDFMAIDVDYDFGQGRRHYELFVSGQTIITWVKMAAESALNSAAGITGSGTQLSPYRVSGIADWLAAWNVTRMPASRARHLYYSIGGRTIQKIAQKLPRGGEPDGFADGFYMRDVAFSGTDPSVATGNIWSRRDGASYREFGKFIDQGNQVAAMEGVVWSQRLGSQLRTILKGKTGAYAGRSAAPTTKPAHAARADTLSALPMLSAAMFLAEPSRNSRAWVIGLMLLDLLGIEYQAGATNQHAKHLTLQRAFANPKRLTGAWLADNNLGADTAPITWVQAQTRDRKVIATMSRPGSPAVEGLYPPSPKWSGRTSSNVTVATDYIQQKEVGVAASWLAEEFNRYVGAPVHVTAQRGNAGTRTNLDGATFAGERAMNDFSSEVSAIMRKLITMRAMSFDSPGMLFR